MLNDHLVVDRKVPGEVTGAIPLRAGAKRATAHSDGMLKCPRVPIARTVNGDVGRPQPEFEMAAVFARRHEHLLEIESCRSRICPSTCGGRDGRLFPRSRAPTCREDADGACDA